MSFAARARARGAGQQPGRLTRQALPLGLLVVALALAGCALPGVLAGDSLLATPTRPGVIVTPTTPVPHGDPSRTAEDEVTRTPPGEPLPTSGATITPLSSPAPSPTPAVTPCASQACVAAAAHFWLERPIPVGQGFVDYVDRSYPYGSTQNGAREPHHGVEFFNGGGTPIIAAAAGTVVVASDDQVTAYGPATRFYGKLVVVELDRQLDGRPVFNLYGHMQSVGVAVGDQVQAGDPLGTVGSTGVAIGAHLHFEVRVGANDYASTRNPELWLRPAVIDGASTGAIAGRVVDPDGNPLSEITVVIRPLRTNTERPRNRFPLTYAADGALINGDDRLQENFAIGDMPAGLYSVSVNTTRFYQQEVTVRPNQVGWVTFVVNPPLPTPPPGTPSAEPPAAPPTDTPAFYPPAESPTPAEAQPPAETPSAEPPTPAP
jgi:murein DD-endopeptidase MepM/ murein hydrolase activator NlpD